MCVTDIYSNYDWVFPLKNNKGITITNVFQKMLDESINKLDGIGNKYNNAYHSTIKMKHVDVKSSKYIDFGKKDNRGNPKFNVGDYVRISRYKNTY